VTPAIPAGKRALQFPSQQSNLSAEARMSEDARRTADQICVPPTWRRPMARISRAIRRQGRAVAMIRSIGARCESEPLSVTPRSIRSIRRTLCCPRLDLSYRRVSARYRPHQSARVRAPDTEASSDRRADGCSHAARTVDISMIRPVALAFTRYDDWRTDADLPAALIWVDPQTALRSPGARNT